MRPTEDKNSERLVGRGVDRIPRNGSARFRNRSPRGTLPPVSSHSRAGSQLSSQPRQSLDSIDTRISCSSDSDAARRTERQPRIKWKSQVTRNGKKKQGKSARIGRGPRRVFSVARRLGHAFLVQTIGTLGGAVIALRLDR